LDKIVQSIRSKGWSDSVIRVMKNPIDENRYLCIDGMHRVSAMTLLKNQDNAYANKKINAMVYPVFSEFDQCILADSNKNLLI
jgi:hypothetical protein